MRNTASADELSDHEIAQLEQARLNSEGRNFMPMRSLRNSDVGSDEEYALKLQQEEYSKPSLLISSSTQSYRRPYPQSNTASTEADAVIAARLQAEENARQEREQQRLIRRVQRRRSPPQTIQLPENLRIFPGNRIRSGDLQHRQDNFTPNDYERLLELDGEERHPKLNNEQIDAFPTETFVPRPNQSEQDTTCSVCWDKYQARNILRRLPCLHTFHRDCIDPWLKMKSQCPICRVDPNQR